MWHNAYLLVSESSFKFETAGGGGFRAGCETLPITGLLTAFMTVEVKHDKNLAGLY